MEANATEPVPSANGRVPGDTPTSIHSRAGRRKSSQQATAVVRGTDPDGAQWTLRLYGPGALNVVDTNGDQFTRSTQNLVESIDTIIVAGAITTETRLVGTVHPDPNTANARVYFQNLFVTPTGELGKIDEGQVSNFRIVQNGILAIDMPDFYLGHTETTTPSTPSSDPQHGHVRR